jgi:hypothetical protein
MLKKIIGLSVGILLVGSAALAKDIEAGKVEIAGRTNASFAIDLDADNTFGIGVEGFYYVMPNIGVGAFLDFTKTFGDEDSSSLAIGPEGIYNYSLSDAASLYGRAGIGYLQTDAEGVDGLSGWTFVAAGGAKYFVTESVSLNGELNFTHDGGDYDSNVITALFGVSFYLP